MTTQDIHESVVVRFSAVDTYEFYSLTVLAFLAVLLSSPFELSHAFFVMMFHFRCPPVPPPVSLPVWP